MKLPILIISVLLVACQQSKTPTPAPVSESVHPYSEPVWADPLNVDEIRNTMPIVDKLYRDYAEQNHFPAISYGVIARGELIYSGNVGVANVATKTPATSKTLFRIASMSKSFTAMAILKLRDEGKLSLHDPVAKYIPEMNKAGQLTRDAAPITVQNLLTMSAGFPEDNPWGDRQLDATDQELLDMVSQGLSFSNVPGVAFEYSNLGFALLGRIITTVSGVPYQQYITTNIMEPIGMRDSRWEFNDVPSDQLALGYQWIDNEWQEVPMLHDGAYGAMGGLICSIEDYSKYVALHLAAWPPRDEEETGPIRRSSIREMHQPWRFNNLFADAKNRMGENCAVAVGYGYGLGWRKDCKGTVRISHSGGLPGFGSEWRFYPEYGIGVVSFSNHTYGAPAANAVVLDTIIHLAGLKPRTLPPSEILKKRQSEIVKLLPEWQEEGNAFFAENFFMDESVERRREATRKIWAELGEVVRVTELQPENQLRGSFMIEGEKKNAQLFFTLTPQREALIQQLDIELVDRP